MLKIASLCLMGAGAMGREWMVGDKPYSGSLRSTSSSLCDSNVKQLSGYFDISGTKNAHYFYWMFESRADPTNDPFIIWMTGGPGCSSTLAMLSENGPCTVNEDLTTTLNPNSWTEHANMLWIDQPTGVGYSYGDKTDYVSNEEGVAENMYQFLQAFFEAHPEYQKNDFYVTGESYGGHYVPAVSHRVWQGNNANPDVHINLKGIAIGNGLTAPEIQYPLYPQMAMNNTYGIKTVTESQYESMLAGVSKCQSLIHTCNTKGTYCTIAETYCNSVLLAPYEGTGLNVYDIRRPCGSDPLCYNFDAITSFLNSAAVKNALGVTSASAAWQSCNNQVNSQFTGDWMRNFDTLLPDLLENGISVLIYAGDCDFICNWMGNKAWTLALDWSGKDAFNAAKDHDWNVAGKKAGTARSAGIFTFLQVNGAGHMVPMDQPVNALSMINTFTSGGTF